MIFRIVLDVDDVLNSLTLHIMRQFGCDLGVYDYDKYPVDVGYDIITACEHLGGWVPYMRDEAGEFIPDTAAFWNTVTHEDLWRTAPKSPQCDRIIEEAADLVGREEVLVATTPTKDPTSYAHKLSWMWDNLPSWIHRQHFITPRKWCLGKPGVILFDDHKDNCDRFRQEGGVACLVPRPWNPAYNLSTDYIVDMTLESIREETNVS